MKEVCCRMTEIEPAFSHMVQELGFDKVKVSLEAEFDLLEKAHDAIHEYLLLAPLFFSFRDAQKSDWDRKSAFLFVYHSEVFEQAHRSLMEALCAYYNAAFILLRTTLELLLKGAFWECFSHRAFRDKSRVLDADKRGGKLKDWLREKIERHSHLEEQLELVSASIYDVVGSKIDEPTFRVSVKTIVQQLDEWGMFNPIPEAANLVYQDIYRKLSADVHVVPDRTYIGSRLTSGTSEVFDRGVLVEVLHEYAKWLHQIMDIAIVVEPNVIGDFIRKHKEVGEQIMVRLPELERLELEYGLVRTRDLLDVAA